RAELKQRAESVTSGGREWARGHYDAIVARADAALASGLEVPTIPGEWPHHYVCKDCGIRLSHSNGRHQCSRCDNVYTGWPFDGVVAGSKHSQNFADAENLGLAWQLTGN